ncbi:uncharacterized protein LOC133346563 [Lethenteron reissneri]|uniref:uncharacterized protein LOC133346563 n=1 Tax=Lethenteron reissneri TaxID=7753 RepID=UPI002AB7A678|nr:uncharacterized protein LOC133346563 [Lethenteron reissneri]
MVENDIRKKQHLHNKASASIRQGDTRRSSIPPHAGTLGSRIPEPATRVQISNVVLVNPHEAALQMVRARCGNTVREGPRAFMSCVKDSGMLDGGSSGRQLRVETKREANDPGNKSFPLGNPMNASQSANKQRDTLGQSKIGNMVNELQGKLLAGMMTQLGTERPPQSSFIQEGGSASLRLPLSTTVENKSQLNMTVVAVQVAKLYLELGGYLNKGAKARLAVEDCSVAVYESLREFVECVEKAQAYEVGGPIESILPQSSHRDQGLVVVASRAQERDKHADEKDMAEGEIWLP